MTTISIGGVDISAKTQDWEITVPTSDADVAPTATVSANATVSITANDSLVISDSGTTFFDGQTRSGGTKSELGGTTVTAAHPARELFEDEISLSLSGTDTEAVLQAAISAANNGGTFTLDYAGSTTALGNDYAVENRTVQRVFRDMTDRTDRVWWVDPGGTTIHVEPKGHRGTWKAINTETDKATLQRYDSGDVSTVRNAITLIGTGAVAIEETVEDSTSISEYGRRPADEPYKISYITDLNELQAMGNALLISDPLPEGTLLVGRNVGTITQPLVNYRIDITDNGKNVSATGLRIESQSIKQGRAELQFGGGQATSVESRNRTTKSREDTNPPGTVMPSERIADDAIESSKLVDLSVTEAKLDDLAVATDKLQSDAVITGKLSDLSVSETKIQDDSIATPKLQAGAVTASEVATDTLTASEIAAGTITALEIASDTVTATEIAAGTITASEIAAGTITANEIDAGTITASEIDVLNLTAGDLTVSDPGVDSTFDFEFVSVTGLPDLLAFVSFGSDPAWIGGPGEPFEMVRATDVTPDSDNSGEVGTASLAYSEMNAHNFVTASPDRIDTVDTDGLADVDWYDNPPEPVRQRARAIGATDAEVPAGRDHTPVELGTMANYLLEVSKAQQERIDTLEQRLSRLERQH